MLSIYEGISRFFDYVTRLTQHESGKFSTIDGYCLLVPSYRW